MLICMYTVATHEELTNKNFPESIFRYNLFPRDNRTRQFLSDNGRAAVLWDRNNNIERDFIAIKLSIHIDPQWVDTLYTIQFAVLIPHTDKHQTIGELKFQPTWKDVSDV